MVKYPFLVQKNYYIIRHNMSSCFAALRHIRSIRRSVCQPVLLSLVTSLVLTRLDGSVTLNGITKRLMDRLQSVLNAAARLVHNSRKYNRISPLLRDLHWLRVPERIKFRMAVLVFRCRNQTAPNYLARDLQWADMDDSRRRLRSATTQKLLVRRMHDERSATAPSALLHRSSGTTCLPTSFLHRHWPFSSDA